MSSKKKLSSRMESMMGGMPPEIAAKFGGGSNQSMGSDMMANAFAGGGGSAMSRGGMQMM